VPLRLFNSSSKGSRCHPTSPRKGARCLPRFNPPRKWISHPPPGTRPIGWIPKPARPLGRRGHPRLISHYSISPRGGGPPPTRLTSRRARPEYQRPARVRDQLPPTCPARAPSLSTPATRADIGLLERPLTAARTTQPAQAPASSGEILRTPRVVDISVHTRAHPPSNSSEALPRRV
jgi:hypothetical protein